MDTVENINTVDIGLVEILFVIVTLVAISEFIYIRLINQKYYANKSNTSRENLFSRVMFFKKFWGPFVVYVVATSIILLFVSSFVLNEVITLTVMNEWVSLILGMVALIIGVISLYLSFFNVDQANQSQKETLDEMRKMKDEFLKKFDETKDMFRVSTKRTDFKENSTSVENDFYTSMTVKKKEGDGELGKE